MEIEDDFLFREDVCSENIDTILRVVHQNIDSSKNEKEVLRALEIGFGNTLKQFHVTELEDRLFRHICPAAKNIFLKKLQFLEDSKAETLGTIEITDTWKCCLQIASWFTGVFEHLGNIQVTMEQSGSLLINCGQLLNSSFHHCEISEKVYGSLFSDLGEALSDFFLKNCQLLESFLKFLTENLTDGNEDITLDEVLRVLSKCGMSLIVLDVKTMAKVWKAYAFLAQKHAESLKNGKCVQEAISDLSTYVSSNVESLFCKDEFGSNTQKLVKLSCFVLKLVIKFCEIFNGFLNSCQNALFAVILTLCKCDSILKTKAKAQNSNLDLVCQLTAGIDPLLLQLLSSQELVIECSSFSNSLSQTKGAVPYFALLLCLIVKKLISSHSSTRKVWFNNDNNILEWLFQCVSFGESHFSSLPIVLPSVLISGRQTTFSDLYEYVVVSASAFAMTVTCSEFPLLEKILVKNLLQPDPLKALLAIDIWCILARFETSELCFAQTQTLSHLYKKLSGDALRVEKCYLQSLILRLLPLLNETQKRMYMSAFPTTFYSELFGNFEAFQVFENTSWHELVDALVADRLLDPASHKNLTDRLDEVTLQKLERKVVESWEFNSELLSSCFKKERYLKSACSLAASILPKMRPENLFLVLNQLNKLFSIKQPPCILLYGVQVLTSAASVQIPPGKHQQNIIKTLADIFRSLLSSEDAVVKQKSLNSFYFFAHVTTHEEVIPLTVRNSPGLKVEVTKFFQNKVVDELDFNLDEYMSELHSGTYVHACPMGRVRNVKECGVEANVRQIKDRWKEDGKKIINFIELGLLTEFEKEEIKSSAVRIASLLS